MKIGLLILLFVLSDIECKKKKKPKGKKILVKSERPAFAKVEDPVFINKKTLTEFISQEAGGVDESIPRLPAKFPSRAPSGRLPRPARPPAVAMAQREREPPPPPPPPPRPTRGPQRSPMVVVTPPPASAPPPPAARASTQCFLAICTDIDGMLVT